MYSRYTPNANGGFDRRQLPDEADLRAAQGRAPPPVQEHNTDTPIPPISSAGAKFSGPPPASAAQLPGYSRSP